MLRPRFSIRLVPVVAVVLAFLLVSVLATGPAVAQMGTRLIPFESVTLSTQQVLVGETQGKPATLAGELRVPGLGTDKLPLVVLVHGIGGVNSGHDEWARVLNGWGMAVFIPDHLSGRGITPMSPEDFGLPGTARMVDIYQAIPRLLKHPRVDPERIGIMGTSMGALVTIYSSQERFRTRYAPPDFRFAAFIGLYANCAIRLHDDVKVTARPIRLFHGTGDDWTPVEQCRTLVADLKANGADITLTEYAGASHAYDNATWKERLNLPTALSLRKCSLAEGEKGVLLNAQTGKPFAPNDPCIEKGVSIQYDEAATVRTREAVKAELAAAFSGKPAAGASK
jgi:dienelactone hydrolase